MRFATKSAVLIAIVASLFSFAKFEHCRVHGWGGSEVYVHACYSDLPALLLDRHLNTHQWPYKDGNNAVEYPPGVAMVMWATSFAVDHNYKQYRNYFDVNAILISLLFIFVVILLKKMSPEYWYLAPLAPAVIASLFINWDIWAVLPALLSIYWFDNKKYERSALSLGIAIATKFFPVVLLIPIFFNLFQDKKNLIRFNLIAIGSAMFINLPFAITTPEGWFRFYKLNISRGVDWGSIWHALSVFGINTNALNILAILTFLIGTVFYSIFIYKNKSNLAASAFLIVALFVTASKVYSPQYILWLTPLAVNALKNRNQISRFWIWQITEMIYHLAIWQHLAVVAGAKFGISDHVYALSVFMRIAGLAYFCSGLIQAPKANSTADYAPQSA